MREAGRTRIGLVVTTVIVVVALLPVFLAGQEDGDTPLGDVARSFRKKNPPAQEVIDNDNLSKVMDQVENHRLSTSLRYSVDAGGKSFQVSAPDVTCSLAFSANTKALLASQYVQLDLPADELLKLDGPATIDGDALQVSVFNGTNWHVSEVAVALTLVKRAEAHNAVSDYGAAKLIPAVAGDTSQVPDSRSEKRSDVTVLYRMRAAAAPSATTVFRAPLNVEIGPDQEWHWAIVEARGYPPQSPAGSIPPTQTPAQSVLAPARDLTPQSVAVTPGPSYPSGTRVTENPPPSLR